MGTSGEIDGNHAGKKPYQMPIDLNPDRRLDISCEISSRNLHVEDRTKNLQKSRQGNKIKMMYTNVQSLLNKMDEIKLVVDHLQPDFIALTETWLNEQIADTEVRIDGFQLIRMDRNGRRGGGIAMFIREGIDFIPDGPSPSRISSCEILCCKLKVPNQPDLHIAVVYRPPGQRMDTDEALIAEVKQICRSKHLLILGDFNAPDIDWVSMYCSRSENSFEQKLLQLVNDEFLTQHVTMKTRFRNGQQSSCLDLIIRRDDNCILALSSYVPLGRSDHCVLAWEYSHLSVPKRRAVRQRNVWKADYPKIKELLNGIDWSPAHAPDPNAAWFFIIKLIQQLVEKFCPLKRRSCVSRPEWVTSEIKRNLKKKRRLWRTYARYQQPEHFSAFKKQRNRCRNLLRKERSNFESEIVKDIPRNSKRFYAYVNKAKRNRDCIPCLKDNQGNRLIDNSDKTCLLSNFFMSVYTEEPFFDEDEYYSTATSTNKISTVSFPMDTVRKTLKQLQPTKSPGPDGISAKVLNELTEQLALPLSKIFESSMEAGALPTEWKIANITPIYKGGERTSPNSFRPVSLTSICCKMMEKIIKTELMRHLEENNLLSSYQHGFRSGRSCLTNLLTSMESWTKSLEMGLSVDAVYIDFSKAFDRVPHKRLIFKLRQMGVTGNLLKWLADFLTDRRQRVCIGDTKSHWETVHSGVPQGSVLGPILFLIYVNDCLDCLTCEKVMFADDLKLWNSIEKPEDARKLQQNLDRLQTWCDEWLLNLNLNKCQIIRLRSSSRRLIEFEYQYSISGHQLQEVNILKDLGIWITPTLKPSSHCANIAKKAMCILGAIRRSFVNFDGELFGRVFGTFIRPVLEYCVQAWRPWTKHDYALLEKVQRRATKLVSGLECLPYEGRLERLKIFPLSYRQYRGDMILVFKLVRGVDCALQMANFFELANMTSLRGHQYKLKRNHAKLEVRANFFSQRVIDEWNKLPASVVQAESVEMFKRRLDAFLLDEHIFSRQQ
uniref:Reverse transcriptase domain-containing protein n=1 Tax=Schistocephalus solidus TaxID=70667 RepID=A0A0X3PTK8_SCHSO